MQTVSDLLGHEDLLPTKRYLGINFKDHRPHTTPVPPDNNGSGRHCV